MPRSIRATAFSAALILLLILGPALLVQAQSPVPPTVSYQGRVTVGGQPFNGTGHFKFAIVTLVGATTWSNDGSSVNGGEPLSSVPVEVRDGVFSILLGEAPPLFTQGMEPLSRDAFPDGECTLSVWFSPDGDAFSLLGPPRPISAVPYAYVAADADTLDGWHAADLAPRDHSHWGAIWEGDQFGLTLRNTGANPTAVNLAFHGNGLTVDSAKYDGVQVTKADDDGIQIGLPYLFGGGYDGPKDDGLEIWHVGSPSGHTMPSDAGLGNTHDGLALAGAEGFGVWVGYAGQSGLRVQRAEANGVHVESTGGSGLNVRSAALDGVNIREAAFSGISIGEAGHDGLYVYDVGNAPTHVDPYDLGFEDTSNGTRISGVSDFGHWVGFAGQDGLHVNRASRDGVHVGSAGRYAVYAGGDVHVEGNLTWKAQENSVSVPAAAFLPWQDDVDYVNNGQHLWTVSNRWQYGCETYAAPLMLPQGAVIKSFTAYFYATEEMGAGRFTLDCGDVYVGLTRYALQNSSGDSLGFAYPVGPAAAESTVSASAAPSTGAVVDNSQYTYVLVLNLPNFAPAQSYNGSKVRFKGVMICYESAGPH